jgi:Tol biopolymer transport system component
MTADGLKIVFSSERVGGRGDGDLWMANRSSKENPWSKPVNLGSEINTEGREWGPAISSDGLKLRYTRFKGGGGGVMVLTAARKTTSSPWSQAVDVTNRHFRTSHNLTRDGLTLLASRNHVSEGGTSSNELWIGMRSSLQVPWNWRMMTRLSAPVSTEQDESDGTLSEDGRLFFFTRWSATNLGSRSTRIFMSIRADWDVPWSDPVRLSPANAKSEHMPRLLPDGKAVLFLSQRPGGEGHGDIWMAKLVKKENISVQDPPMAE